MQTIQSCISEHINGHISENTILLLSIEKVARQIGGLYYAAFLYRRTLFQRSPKRRSSCRCSTGRNLRVQMNSCNDHLAECVFFLVLLSPSILLSFSLFTNCKTIKLTRTNDQIVIQNFLSLDGLLLAWWPFGLYAIRPVLRHRCMQDRTVITLWKEWTDLSQPLSLNLDFKLGPKFQARQQPDSGCRSKQTGKKSTIWRQKFFHPKKFSN